MIATNGSVRLSVNFHEGHMMSGIADEAWNLGELNESGTLLDAPFARGQMASPVGEIRNGASSDNGEQLAELQLQDELFRIDQEWQVERERHKISYGRHSAPTEPNKVGTFTSLVAGLGAVGFGMYWMGQAAKMRAPGFFPLFGLIVIGVGIGLPIYFFIKYSKYKSAHDDYQRRRSEVLAKLSEARSP
jgi:hypothetical protein